MKKFAGMMMAAGVAAGAVAAVVETDSDGTTFDVTDGVLTITVPNGTTNSGYDYVANILNQASYGVTQVVKDGAGTLVPKAAPNYEGLWRVKAGVVDVQVDNAFGKLLAAPDETKKLTVDDGARVTLPKTNTSLNSKYVEMAGGVSSGDSGVLYSTADYTISGARFKLTGDAQLYDKNGTCSVGGGTIDVAGHKFYAAGGMYVNGNYQSNLVVTNSDATTPGRFVAPWSNEYKAHLKTMNFGGGAENVIELTSKGRTYIEGLMSGDWTFQMQGELRGARDLSTTTDKSGFAYGWKGPGPVKFVGTTTVGNRDANMIVKSGNDGYGFVVDAPVSGESTAKVKLCMGAWLSFGGTGSAYQGDLELVGENFDANRRCTVFFQKGMPFLTQPAKTVKIADSDIWMDAETVRQISSLSISAGSSTITGSAAGSSIPSVTMAGSLNTLDTPASIGTYSLNAGTLKIGANVPDITNLVCAAGTALDLNGQDVSVKNLSGIPTILNGGTLTVENSSLDIVPGADLVLAPEIRFPGAVAFTWCGGAFPMGEREVLYFAPGSPEPTCTGTAVAGGQIAFTTRTVASGAFVGYTAIVATVTPAGAAPTHSSTAADGTTFEAMNQVLTIAVPAGVTNADSYATIVSSCFVTNVVKAGDGALDATPMKAYDGDITVLAGEFLIVEDGDLGRKSSGTVRVRDGGAIRVKDGVASGAITYKTIEFEGYGPGGTLGAIRGPKTTDVRTPLRYMTYRLTGDAGWLNDVKRIDFNTSSLDVAGHELRILSNGSWAQLGYFNQCAVTNSVPEKGGSVLVATVAGGSYPKLQLDEPSSWRGGTNNLIRSTARTYLGPLTGDWTLVLDGGPVWGAKSGSLTATNVNFFTGPVWVRKSGSFALNDSASACPISLFGPIWGPAENTLTLNAITHLFSDMSGFEGTVAIDGSRNNYYKGRNGVWIHDGCVFHCGAGKRVGIKNSDLTLDTGTAFRLPSFKHTAGEVQVEGGAPGGSAVGRSAFESFENAADKLIFASPAIVSGEMKVSAGTLALGTNGVTRTDAVLPVFSNLVFAAGTTFDMDGNSLTVPNLTGAPTVANAGTITVSGSYTPVIENGRATTWETTAPVAFAAGAKVTIPAGTSRKGVHTLLTTTGGITGMPGVTAPDRFWEVRVEGNSLVAEHVAGMVIFVK